MPNVKEWFRLQVLEVERAPREDSMEEKAFELAFQ